MSSSLGVDFRDAHRRAGEPGELTSEHRLRVTAAEFYALWQASEAEFGNAGYALAAAKAFPVETFDAALIAALWSPSVAAALDRLAKYKPLVAPSQLDVETASHGEIKLAVRWVRADAVPPVSLSAMELALITRLVRMGTRTAVVPTVVGLPDLEHFEGHLAAYEDFFGVSIVRSSTAQVAFSAEDARTPFVTGNHVLWNSFEPGLRQQLSGLEQSTAAGDRAHAVLLKLLPDGRGTVTEVAHAMRMSPRTLQRRLNDEDTTFNEVLTGLRKQLARHYLRGTDLQGNEIARLLGYEDPSSFYRAFHRWHGCSPERFRQAK